MGAELERTLRRTCTTLPASSSREAILLMESMVIFAGGMSTLNVPFFATADSVGAWMEPSLQRLWSEEWKGERHLVPAYISTRDSLLADAKAAFRKEAGKCIADFVNCTQGSAADALPFSVDLLEKSMFVTVTTAAVVSEGLLRLPGDILHISKDVPLAGNVLNKDGQVDRFRYIWNSDISETNLPAYVQRVRIWVLRKLGIDWQKDGCPPLAYVDMFGPCRPTGDGPQSLGGNQQSVYLKVVGMPLLRYLIQALRVKTIVCHGAAAAMAAFKHGGAFTSATLHDKVSARGPQIGGARQAAGQRSEEPHDQQAQPGAPLEKCSKELLSR